MDAVEQALQIAAEHTGQPEPELDPRAAMLAAIPDHVHLADDIDLDALDPAYTGEQRADGSPARQCVAERRAGGRCTAVAPAGSLLCNAHSGVLDPSAGGRALADQKRKAREEANDAAAAARLGTRGMLAIALARNADRLGRAIDVLADLASRGDRQAALALVPFLNQAHGLPSQPVEVSTSDGGDLDQLTSDQLAALVAEKRAAMRVAEPAA